MQYRKYDGLLLIKEKHAWTLFN